jgi:RimJ/RimL family protein N-acetyltransferase
VAEAVNGWSEAGLDYWSVRVRGGRPERPSTGGVVGVAGVSRRRGSFWNLYYRFQPTVQGRGFANEVVAAALAAARAVHGTLPVVAYLLEHNTASSRTAERAGLQLAWRGADRDDPLVVRLIYADRELAPRLLDDLTGR